MEHGTRDSFKEEMEMVIKLEVEEAATSVGHIDIETNLNHLKQESELEQYVKIEPELLVKEEIPMYSSQDCNKQLCVQDSSAHHDACSMCVGDLLNVKQELEDIDIGATVLQHMDIHYTIDKTNLNHLKREPELVQYVKIEPAFMVKEEILMDSSQDGNEQQFVYDSSEPADACSISVGDLLNVKQELEDTNVGTTVLQHMDIQEGIAYTINKVSEIPPGLTRADMSYPKELQIAPSNIPDNKINFTSGKIFLKPHLLSAHRKLQERNCTTSGATSSSVGGPSNVCRSEASKSEPKPLKCDVCDKGYFSEMNLSIHKNFHCGFGLSVCHICNAKFTIKSNLTNHLRTHTGEKPYLCNICGARFTSSGNLTTHKRVHTGEKPYKCNTCDARFTCSGNLTTHKRIHTGEKPYQCDTCNARFTHSCNLSRHKRVHTGEKPYQCNMCDAKFAQSGRLNEHKRRLH